MRKSALFVVTLLLVVAFASPASAQTTITTDGDVQAQGFIGDGSQVTDVDAQLLDSMDSAAFAQETDLQNVERALVAILAQFPGLGKVPLTRTGQTTCYDAAGAVVTCGTGIGLAQDGDLQLGVSWPNPRFTKNGDGTVTDELTGLIWLENADCAAATMNWTAALAFANTLFDGSVAHNGGDCGLSDASGVGAWRLPNAYELHSLVSYGSSPAVPDTSGTGQWSEGDPFSGVDLVSKYWSSTTKANETTHGYRVGMNAGGIGKDAKTAALRVWPVSGGQ